MKSKLYRLEYSEKQGFFHFAEFGDTTPQNSTYKVLSPKLHFLTFNNCVDFTTDMFSKYTDLNTGENKKFVSYEMMSGYFIKYCKENKKTFGSSK
jgi:hypothetical protein